MGLIERVSAVRVVTMNDIKYVVAILYLHREQVNIERPYSYNPER